MQLSNGKAFCKYRKSIKHKWYMRVPVWHDAGGYKGLGSTNCSHPYIIPSGIRWYCLTCRALVDGRNPSNKEYHDVIMPPILFGITERLWEQIRPWPRILHSLVKKYAWYISMIYGQEYLVMPIQRMGKPIFFSARKLSTGMGPKYSYPENVKRLPWISSDELPSPVVICEGVADAAYTSLLGCSSVALLGNYYDGSLDDKLQGKKIILALDGDYVGIVSAVGLYHTFSDSASRCEIVVFPDGKEPTDFSLEELRGYLKL